MPVLTRRNNPAAVPPPIEAEARPRAQRGAAAAAAALAPRQVAEEFDQEPIGCPVKARNPAWVSGEPIDFSSRDGQAFYKAASDPLPEKFDGEAKRLHLFLGRLQARAQRYAWMPMLTYQINGAQKNLIDHHGEISRETIRLRA